METVPGLVILISKDDGFESYKVPKNKYQGIIY